VPGAPGSSWRRWIDTSLESPNDITSLDQAPPARGQTYHVGGRSVVVLFTDSERTIS
jgi:glycogen operon protein